MDVRILLDRIVKAKVIQILSNFFAGLAYRIVKAHISNSNIIKALLISQV